jgi:hypothetical protein
MVDPIFTYIGGIAFLVLIIGSMLYLTFSGIDVEEGDEHPGESIVGGVERAAEEPGEPDREGSAALAEEEPEETGVAESGEAADDETADTNA